MRSLMSYYHFTEMYGAEQKQYLDANNYNNTKRNHATIVKVDSDLENEQQRPQIIHISTITARHMVKFHYGFWQMYLRLETYPKCSEVFPQSLKSKVSKTLNL